MRWAVSRRKKTKPRRGQGIPARRLGSWFFRAAAGISEKGVVRGN
jgi:hypothetical protein